MFRLFLSSKFSGASSNSSALCVPDLFEGHVRHAATFRDGFDFLRNVFLRRSPDVDVVTVARRVVTRNRFPEVVRSVQSWIDKYLIFLASLNWLHLERGVPYSQTSRSGYPCCLKYQGRTPYV